MHLENGSVQRFSGHQPNKSRELFSMNNVGLLTLLSECGDESGKHWRKIQLRECEAVKRRDLVGHIRQKFKVHRMLPDNAARQVGVFFSVPGMAQFLQVKVLPRVFTAKCSEPQAADSNVRRGGSGVAKPASLRTETG